ncbi:DUF1440 domain-containing protein [Nonomuraea guangzhouensis]|uniref:DUF1440 domain-containing protein n=1 Tax=Nonomuraea guangzhouensis TaxID=1291555 RepID=A0ABW4GXN2_9ACTN|nr:DUF1440 domain-containing protein [Nonomuraea guangzhouensis]
MSGLVGGLVFGAVMAQIGFLPTVAAIVRTDSVGLGFAVHLLFAAIIGAGFGVLVERQRAAASELLFWGFVYGALWWFLGPLTLLPILLGQPVTWDLVSGQNLTPSLFGHLAYGAVTAAVFAWRQAPVIRIHLATVARGVMAGLLAAAALVFSLGIMVGEVPYELLYASLAVGGGYGLLFGKRPEGTGPALIRGMVYGFVWWILLVLTAPALLAGGRLDWSIGAVRAALPDLVGYLLLGAGTGAVFTWLGGLGRVLFVDDVRRLRPDRFGVSRLRAACYGGTFGLAGGLIATLFTGPLGLVEGLAAGTSYALFFRGRSFDPASGIGWGLSYGFLWWLLGSLTLWPVLQGGHPQWSAALLAADSPALVGHLAFGAVLGVGYQRLEERTSPWWLTRGQAAAERAIALREQTLGSAPAIWTLVLLLAAIIPTLVVA